MNLTPEQMRDILTILVTLIVSVGLHEFGHAWMATRLGDDTALRQGRLTLNPFAHADPMGTIGFPLIFLIATKGMSTGFGWGKPVPFVATRMTRKVSMVTAAALVAAAGPAMNLALGIVFLITRYALVEFQVIAPGEPPYRALVLAAYMNFGLFVFNLIPTPPLDGGWIARRLLPSNLRAGFEKMSVYGPFILIAFMMIEPLRKVITVPTQYLYLYADAGVSWLAQLV